MKRPPRAPEYNSWLGMKARCHNPANPRYSRYGGRGIKVCERWMIYENFLEDMGPRPGKGYSIDRINNDGDYEPSNCRWATWKQQINNRDNTLIVAFRGEEMLFAEAVQLAGNDYNRVHHRVSSGWDIAAAIEAPRGAKRTVPLRTHCCNGHEFTPENTRIRAGAGRICKECERSRVRDYRRNRFWSGAHV